MNFSNAFQQPVGIKIGQETVLIPRFSRRDWINWGALVDAERLEAATAEMTPRAKRQFQAFTPIAPCTFDELRLRIASPAGAEHVVSTCLKKVDGWDESRIAQFIESNNSQDIELLAAILVESPSPKPPKDTDAGDGGVEDDGAPNPPTRSACDSAD